MSPYKPLNAFDMFDYLTSFDVTDRVLIRLYLLKTIKYYCKAYPDVIKEMLMVYQQEFAAYYEYDNAEKVIISYLKKRYEKI